MCEQLRKKWMYAVYRKQDAENNELDLLVSRAGDKRCGGLKILMKKKVLEFQ